jgi:hypothetical protein
VVVVVVGSREVDVDTEDEVGPRTMVLRGRDVVVVVVARTVLDDWLATCCLGEVSLPVATSKRRATRAMEARA